VLVAARNEETTLPNLVAALAAQTYPPERFSVLIVNDHSTDDTARVIDALAADYPTLTLRRLDNTGAGGKKAALTTGFAASITPWVALTDADCQPPPTWLATLMGAQLATGAGMVAGPVRYAPAAPAPRGLGEFLRLELAGLTALAGGGMALRMPMLANGANLLVAHEVWTAIGGFEQAPAQASGDDLYLVQAGAARGYRVVYQKHRAALVDTLPPATWKALWQQRLRWATKNSRGPLTLHLLAMGNAWLLSLGLVLGTATGQYAVTGIVWLLKAVIDLSILAPAAVFVQDTRVLRRFISIEIIQTVYVALIGLASLTLKRYNWKGRRVQ
jgi:glycosyltransferase involved in cell wall biosynthesis